MAGRSPNFYPYTSILPLDRVSQNLTTALEQKPMAQPNTSVGASSYPMASLYVGKFEYIFILEE
jgi:hypothetical protein